MFFLGVLEMTPREQYAQLLQSAPAEAWSGGNLNWLRCPSALVSSAAAVKCELRVLRPSAVGVNVNAEGRVTLSVESQQRANDTNVIIARRKAASNAAAQRDVCPLNNADDGTLTCWGINLRRKLGRKTRDGGVGAGARSPIKLCMQRPPMCEHDGCTSPPTFNLTGKTRARFCDKHRTPDMVAKPLNNWPGRKRAFQWASETICRHFRGLVCYVNVKYSIFNPNHNGGRGSDSVVRYCFGPVRRRDVATADDVLNLIEREGNYGYNCPVSVLDFTIQPCKTPTPIACDGPTWVRLERAVPMQYPYLKHADCVSKSSLVVRPTDDCVPVAILQHMLHPPVNNAKNKFNHSEYDAVLLAAERAALGVARLRLRCVPTTETTVRRLLNILRDKIDPCCDSGYCTEVIKRFCEVVGIGMRAMDKSGRLIAFVDNPPNCDYTPLCFYAFNGHMYLLADQSCLKSLRATFREQRRGDRVELLATRPTSELAREIPETSGDEPFFVLEGDVCLNPDMDAGMYFMRGVPDLRSSVLQLMGDHRIEPRIQTNGGRGAVRMLSFKSATGKEDVNIAADPHPSMDVDHDRLRQVCKAAGLAYAPCRGMGTVVANIQRKLCADRCKLTPDQLNALLGEQNSQCNICLADLTNCEYDVDHIVPIANAGADEVANMQCLCRPCHTKKTAEDTERGYFLQNAYGSQFNGHVHDALIGPDAEHALSFKTTQHVEAFWLYEGAVVEVVDHDFYADGSPVRVTSVSPLHIDAERGARIKDMSTVDHDRMCLRFENKRAMIYQLRWTEQTLLSAPTCPPAFKANPKWVRLAEHKIDINRCRRNALYYAEHPWPVFCAMDEVAPYDGKELTCGLYYVVCDKGVFGRTGGFGWYCAPFAQHGLDNAYFTRDAIKWQLKPSTKLEPNHFRNLINALESRFVDEPKMRKLAINTLVGLMARGEGERRRSYLSTNEDEALCKLFESGGAACKVHVSTFGVCVDALPSSRDDVDERATAAGVDVYGREDDILRAFGSASTPSEGLQAAAAETGMDVEVLAKLCDCTEVTQAEHVTTLAQSRTAYPIYLQVLQMGELMHTDAMRLDIEANHGGFVLEVSTDSLYYAIPQFLFPICSELNPTSTPEIGQNLSHSFWDDEEQVPRWKWEQPRRLRANHVPKGLEKRPPEWRPPHGDEAKWVQQPDGSYVARTYAPRELTWTNLLTDGPDVASDGDWGSVARTALKKRGANIDGPPGTGKSTLVRTMLQIVTQEQGGGCIALAPTNVAARNLGDSGQTVASFTRRWHQAQTGGRAHALMDTLANTSCLFVDEVSMLTSDVYAVLQEVRRVCPALHIYMVGDFRQLKPIKDVWSGSDYAGSSSLHYLCDGNRVQLSHCRRSDRALFDAYMNADAFDVHNHLPPTLTRLHLAYKHETRKKVNEQCMQEFAEGDVRTVKAPVAEQAEAQVQGEEGGAEQAEAQVQGEEGGAEQAEAQVQGEEEGASATAPKDTSRLDPHGFSHSQDIHLFVGLPLVCCHTKKNKGEAIFANSDIWICTAFDDTSVTIQRELGEVDREKDRAQCDMPVHTIDDEELMYRFRPGFCITVYASQGKTFREPYTIHDWNFKHMPGSGRYVALSRGQSIDMVYVEKPRRQTRDATQDAPRRVEPPRRQNAPTQRRARDATQDAPRRVAQRCDAPPTQRRARDATQDAPRRVVQRCDATPAVPSRAESPTRDADPMPPAMPRRAALPVRVVRAPTPEDAMELLQGNNKSLWPQLREYLSSPQSKVAMLAGNVGCGKTTSLRILARQLQRSVIEFDCVEFATAREIETAATRQSLGVGSRALVVLEDVDTWSDRALVEVLSLCDCNDARPVIVCTATNVYDLRLRNIRNKVQHFQMRPPSSDDVARVVNFHAPGVSKREHCKDLWQAVLRSRGQHGSTVDPRQDLFKWTRGIFSGGGREPALAGFRAHSEAALVGVAFENYPDVATSSIEELADMSDAFSVSHSMQSARAGYGMPEAAQCVLVGGVRGQRPFQAKMRLNKLVPMRQATKRLDVFKDLRDE